MNSIGYRLRLAWRGGHCVFNRVATSGPGHGAEALHELTLLAGLRSVATVHAYSARCSEDLCLRLVDIQSLEELLRRGITQVSCARCSCN